MSRRLAAAALLGLLGCGGRDEAPPANPFAQAVTTAAKGWGRLSVQGCATQLFVCPTELHKQ